MKGKVKWAAAAAAAVLALACVVGVKVWHDREVARVRREWETQLGSDRQVVEVTPDFKVDAATIREVIAPASKLISYQYFYTDADEYEKSSHFFGTDVKVPFTTDRTIFTYSGTISAGVDLSKMKVETDDVKKLISVELPAPEVLAHELDLRSFRSYDVRNSIFTTVDLTEYAGMQAALKDKQEAKLSVNEEFWKNLKENTKTVLNGLLTASGAAGDYTVLYYWAK